jgi:dihydrofolate reductase
MELIVAIDENYGIGYDESLLIHIPNDLKNFKELTNNNIVVYGRKTLKSFRGHKPLPNRTNVILSRGMFSKESMPIYEMYKMDNVIPKNSLEETLSYIKEQEALGNKVYIIGGEQIYKQFLDYCEGAYVTKIFAPFLANKFFPNIDRMENWQIDKTIENEIYHSEILKKNIEYAIIHYKNNSPKEY